MNRDEARKFLPILEAFANGKDVQFETNGVWHDAERPTFSREADRWRIKPAKRLRPYRGDELPHMGTELFDLARKKTSLMVTGRDICSCRVWVGSGWYDADELLDQFCHPNGAPCGVEE